MLAAKPNLEGLTVGQVIRVYREAFGWTQEYLAQRTGKKEGTVGRWERGEANPPRSIREQLYALFAMTPEERSALELPDLPPSGSAPALHAIGDEQSPPAWWQQYVEQQQATLRDINEKLDILLGR